jgi:hypothetical protein
MPKFVLTLTLFLFLGAGLIFLGCGGGGTKTIPPRAEITNGGHMVDILIPHKDGMDGLIYTIGIGSSRDLSIARSMAVQRARADMALRAKAHVAALAEDVQKQIGPGNSARIIEAFTRVSESLADETLIGTVITQTKATKKSGLYDVQIMLGMPVKSNLDDATVREIGDDEVAKQQFEAYKAKEDLAKKIFELREREGKQ